MTKNAFLYLVLSLFLAGTTAGCWGCFGNSNDDSQTEMTPEEDNDGENNEADPPENLTEAMNQAQNALQDAFGGKGGTVKEAVDFRDLKALIPEKVAGLDRTSHTGERTGAMGMNLSVGQGKFENGNQWMEIIVSDLGTLSGFARMAHAAWLQIEVDRETDQGFERTRTFEADGKEYPSFEKFEGDGDEGRCEIQVWVAERFIVSVKGRNVEMEQCEEGRDEISYRQLDRMKDVGREAE